MRPKRAPLRSNLHPVRADVMRHGDQFRLPKNPILYTYLCVVPDMASHWLVADGKHLTTIDLTAHSTTD